MTNGRVSKDKKRKFHRHSGSAGGGVMKKSRNEAGMVRREWVRGHGSIAREEGGEQGRKGDGWTMWELV